MTELLTEPTKEPQHVKPEPVFTESGDNAAAAQDAGRVPLTDLARQLLEGANQAHLATVMPNGAPHSVPLWVGLEGNDLVFLTDPSSRKVGNIEHDQRVAVSVTDRDQPFTMAQIRGRVIRRIEGEEAWTMIDRISRKYVGRPYPREQDRVVFLVRPEHVQSAGYA